MAGQKQARAGSGQGKGSGTATRSGGSSAAAGRDRNAPPRNTQARGGNAQPNRNGRGAGSQARPQARARAQAAEPPAPDAGAAPYAPPWLRWTTLVLSLAGLGVSIYLTIAHYTSSSVLACSDKGVVNCAKVTTSPESMVFGVLPVAVLGLAFYVFMVAASTPWAWALKWPPLWWARLGSAIVGIGFVLYLVYVEIIQIGNICLWCTSVHVITFLLFGLLVFAATMGTPKSAPQAG